ncbi:MAG: flagellar biosynthesis anti-sigma factor FlgM [Tissierellia bacterium]|nr:flagellar biosynthesis anti-sigma factor FlgM [Tissierellia bacterium]
MRIQNINNYINFQGNCKPVKKDEVNKTKKYDVIEIKNKDFQDSQDSNIKKDLVSKINERDIDKINRIKERIKNETYTIDVEEIVKKMLR